MAESGCQNRNQKVDIFCSNKHSFDTPRILDIIVVYGLIHCNILCAVQDFEVKLTLHRSIFHSLYGLICELLAQHCNTRNSKGV